MPEREGNAEIKESTIYARLRRLPAGYKLRAGPYTWIKGPAAGGGTPIIWTREDDPSQERHQPAFGKMLHDLIHGGADVHLPTDGRKERRSDMTALEKAAAVLIEERQRNRREYGRCQVRVDHEQAKQTELDDELSEINAALKRLKGGK